MPASSTIFDNLEKVNVASDLVLRLERKIDQLLERQRLLEQENLRQAGKLGELVAERERFAGELDRILEKLDRIERGAS